MSEELSLPAGWEAAKENIQPLRRGRNIALLTEALTMGPAMLEEKKREFEEALRAYEGDDPLEVWDSYLTWLEEHYPSGLHGVHLPQLLENCISAFISEPDHRYDNDPRFVRIWLKFAGLQVHPEEVYKCMSARGVGVGSASFYIEWAEFHELSGEPRVAQEILEKGVQMLAQPLEQVRSALKELILRLAQGSTRPQESDPPRDEDSDNSRSAFSRLRLEPSHSAPVIRVGRNRLAPNPGPIPQAALQDRPSSGGAVRSTNRSKLLVFDEGSSSSAIPPASSGDSLFTGMGTLAGSASQSYKMTSEKENARKAKKMAREKIVQKVTPRAGPAFEIVPDESADESAASSSFSTSSKSRPHVFLGSALSARKNTATEMALSHILAPDINEKRMYDFLAVYAGTSEFQFEEIRLARMKKQQKTVENKDSPSSSHEGGAIDDGSVLIRQDTTFTENDGPDEASLSIVTRIDNDTNLNNELAEPSSSSKVLPAVMSSEGKSLNEEKMPFFARESSQNDEIATNDHNTLPPEGFPSVAPSISDDQNRSEPNRANLTKKTSFTVFCD